MILLAMDLVNTWILLQTQKNLIAETGGNFEEKSFYCERRAFHGLNQLWCDTIIKLQKIVDQLAV